MEAHASPATVNPHRQVQACAHLHPRPPRLLITLGPRPSPACPTPRCSQHHLQHNKGSAWQSGTTCAHHWAWDLAWDRVWGQGQAWAQA